MKETHDAPGVLGTRLEVERYLRLYLKPKPRLMPWLLYRWLMGRVVLYESLPFVTLRVNEEAADDVSVLLAQRGHDIKKHMGVKDN